MKKNKNELPPIESRSITCEVRTDGKDGNVITGRPIVYDTYTDMGWYREMIVKGALDMADISDVRFLINHDISGIPLARARAGSSASTMQISIDEKGMPIRIQLDTERNEQARALYSAVERGDITGMSFMFSVKSDEWDDIDTDYPTRKIIQIGSVIEVSAVNFPAYASTEIYARDKEGALENARIALERAREERAKAVETAELILLKEKTKILGGI